MIGLSVKNIAEIINADLSAQPKGTVSGVSIDSRSVRDGDIFFAIKGENFDGHDYIANAFANGAVCAVVQKSIDCALDKPVLIVGDTIFALGLLAKFVRDNSGFKVAAITGSAGKTTTKNMLKTVLDDKFKCFSSPKSYNNHIGVPLTLLSAPADCDIVICELGSNNPGEIEYLSKICSPDVAVVTTICPAHLAGFKCVEAIIKEKVSIASGLPAGGAFFINGDKAELINYCRQNNIEFTTFGTTESCQLRAEGIELLGESSSFCIEGKKINLPMPGRANVENAAAVWAVSKFFGISVTEFAEIIVKVKPSDMRMEVLRFGSLTVLSDCYNANPGSMENALETVSAMAKRVNKRAVFIFGKMGELGSDTEKFHKLLGKQIVEYSIPAAFTIAGPTETTIAEFKAGGGKISAVFENVAQLCNNLHKFVKPDDILVVKASRSERFELVVNKLKNLSGLS